MPNHFTKRFEQVKAEQDIHKAVTMAVDIADEAITQSEQERKELRDMVTKLTKTICGNGDPTNSLMSRIATLEKDNMNTCKLLGEIKLLLKGDLSTHKDSLIDKMDNIDDRLQSVEKGMGNVNRVVWMILGTVLAAIVTAVLTLL
jgi:uncharacterized protein YdcH (DUF465 family)